MYTEQIETYGLKSIRQPQNEKEAMRTALNDVYPIQGPATAQR